MNNISFLYCTFLCVIFLYINYRKVGLRNKTFILPSTLFAMMWGVSSVGCFLYSNKIIGQTEYYVYASHLEGIGNYQFMILLTAFIAFIIARIKYKKLSIQIPFNFGNDEVPRMRKKIKWFLYAFFLIGIIRLGMVVTTYGFDYAIIRSSYVENRASFSSFDLNLIRIGSYLLLFAQYYICLFGIESAAKGINYKQLIYNFILFSPFQMSFGGRLFILSFFMPFLFSYLLTFYSLKLPVSFRKKEKRKIRLVFIVPLFLLIFFQMLKKGVNLDLNSFSEFSTELFYTSSAYIHLNEFWANLPINFEFEYGRNILGFESVVYKGIKDIWLATHNSAIVCIPSMIPQMYLDFGKYGSLIVYFILFYNLEKYAFLSLKKINIKGFLTFILLCLVSYQTTASYMSDILKSLIIGYVAIIIITKMLRTNNNHL